MSRRRIKKRSLFKRIADWFRLVFDRSKKGFGRMISTLSKRRFRSSLKRKPAAMITKGAARQKRWILYAAGGAALVAIFLLALLIRPAGTKETASAIETATVNPADETPAPTLEPTPTPDPTLIKGMEGEEVSKLQTRLMDLGYLDIDEPTQYFGPATKFAVQLFQRQHSIQQDGIAGPETLIKIFAPEAQKYTMLEGTTGSDVEDFQRRLVELGYLTKVTGYYGDETIAAVKEFQKRNGLSVDGMAGEKTVSLVSSPEAKPSATKIAEARRKANITEMVQYAAKQLGDHYVRGAEGPNSFDCSGLVYYCLKMAGSNRGRYNAAGYSKVSDWEKITNINSLKKGDLIFFYDNAFSKVGHVGIVAGGGMMIDASSSNGKVVRRTYATTYWRKHFVCGRRPW